MSPAPALTARDCLPRDPDRALLVGRAWSPAEDDPCVVAVRGDEVVDLTRAYPTTSHLLNVARPADVRAAMERLGLGQDPGTPEGLRARIKKETATWAAIIKDAGIRVQ